MAGLSRFWDGYDNQPIVWIDDPVSPDSRSNSEDMQQFKTLLSCSGPMQVQIKGGAVQFDSDIIIISGNTNPADLADKFGLECRDAIYRRLTDEPGSHYVAGRREAVRIQRS